VKKDIHSSFTSKLLYLALKLPNFRSEVEQKPYDEIIWSEMWFLLLLADISEGNYYSNPEKMLEIQHGTPCTIKKELIDAIIHSDGKTWSYKAGTSVFLREYHLSHLTNLFLLWLIYSSYFLSPSIYYKNKFGKISWYCPWFGCNISKTWFFLHSVKQKKPPQTKNAVKVKK
jgi:hypothetical protein